MISVIVCSTLPAPPADWEADLRLNIGMPSELIWMHNPGRKSISAQWNAGAEQANYPFLCFMHDDARVMTPDWGQKVLNHLGAGVEVIGIAGSCYRSAYPSGWMSGVAGCDYYHVCHVQNGKHHWWSNRKEGELYSPVLVADGVWLCCSKAHWKQIPFSESLYAHFHFYDVDFTWRSSRNHVVAVVHDIDILHNSKGRFDSNWIAAALAYCQYNKGGELPAYLGPLSAGISDCEAQVRRFWKQRLKGEPISLWARLRWHWQSFF